MSDHAAVIQMLRQAIEDLEGLGSKKTIIVKAAKGPTFATPKPGDTLEEVVVGMWKVTHTASGRRMGTLSPKCEDIAAAEYWRIFDEDLIDRVHPLMPGDEVRCTIRPWKDTFVVVGIEAQRSAPRAITAMAADEIPF